MNVCMKFRQMFRAYQPNRSEMLAGIVSIPTLEVQSLWPDRRSYDGELAVQHLLPLNVSDCQALAPVFLAAGPSLSKSDVCIEKNEKARRPWPNLE